MHINTSPDVTPNVWRWMWLRVQEFAADVIRKVSTYFYNKYKISNWNFLPLYNQYKNDSSRCWITHSRLGSMHDIRNIPEWIIMTSKW